MNLSVKLSLYLLELLWQLSSPCPWAEKQQGGWRRCWGTWKIRFCSQEGERLVACLWVLLHTYWVSSVLQLWLLCLLGGHRATGSSRSPRQRGAKGKKVLCQILNYMKKWRIPFLKCTTPKTLALAIWGKGHLQMMPLVYSPMLSKCYTPSVLMGDFFPLFQTILKWSNVSWSYCLFREAKESGATLEYMGRKVTR